MSMFGKKYIQEKWLDKFCLLNVAKTKERGLAPHKPILLLCIIDMIEDRTIITPWVQYSPELFFRFQCYWEIVFERQKNRLLISVEY